MSLNFYGWKVWDAVRARVSLEGSRGAYVPIGSSTPVRKGIMPSDLEDAYDVVVRGILQTPSLSATVNITMESLLGDLNTYGFLFEGMCERDPRIYAEVHNDDLKHCRDSEGNEIDAIVELPDGRWGAFEIKLGMNQVDEAAEKLLRMNEKFQDSRRPPEFLCVLVGLSSYAYRREDGVYVVPMTALGH